MTSITYLGHASFLFETEKAACLIDPWYSQTGAFLGTWWQFPPNRQVFDWVLRKLKSKPTMIYVTHEHEDHYDQLTLKELLPHAAGLYIPRYEDDFFCRLIEKNLGVSPRLVDEDKPNVFQDFSFKIFIEESGINRDSAIFLRAKDLSFFDVNDCKIYDRAAWLVERCGPIDVLSCQFSGANMHPFCYDMPENRLRDVCRQKKLRKFVAVRQFLTAMKPRYYVPSGGPALFPLPEHESLNFGTETIFPKWWDFQSWLAGREVPFAFVPLDVLGCAKTSAGGELGFEKLAEKISEDEVRGMITECRGESEAEPTPDQPARDEVLAFFEREISAKLAVLKKYPEVRFGCTLYIEIADAAGATVRYRVDSARCALETTEEDLFLPPYYLHRTSVGTLGKLMRSGKSWETYCLSFQFRNKRVPDVFDSSLATFMVSNDAHSLDFGLRKLAEFRNGVEYITLVSPDKSRSVTCKRFCPHQGADLSYALFDGRYVVCPRHQWRYDCEQGGKADHSNDSIDATLCQRRYDCEQPGNADHSSDSIDATLCQWRNNCEQGVKADHSGVNIDAMLSESAEFGKAKGG